MNGEVITQIASAVAPMLVALGAYLGRTSRRRATLRHDAETLNLLPEGSAARDSMTTVVNREALALEKVVTGANGRDSFGLGLALVGIGGLGYLSVWSVQQGGWWLVLATGSLAMLLVFVVGFVESVQVRDRSEPSPSQVRRAKRADEKAAKAAAEIERWSSPRGADVG